MGRVAIPAPERFWPKVQKTDTCWLWSASLDNRGYGAFRVSTRNTDGMAKAHTFAYELLRGPVPDGLVLDHLCRVRHCVNPDHLEPVTMGENTRRGVSPVAQNARQTHCKRGHELPSERTSQGRRLCRPCRKAQHAQYRVATRTAA